MDLIKQLLFSITPDHLLGRVPSLAILQKRLDRLDPRLHVPCLPLPFGVCLGELPLHVGKPTRKVKRPVVATG